MLLVRLRPREMEDEASRKFLLSNGDFLLFCGIIFACDEAHLAELRGLVKPEMERDLTEEAALDGMELVPGYPIKFRVPDYEPYRMVAMARVKRMGPREEER